MRLAGRASASVLDRPRLFDIDMSNIPVKPYYGTVWQNANARSRGATRPSLA